MKFSIAKILILLLLISALICGFAACNNDTDDTDGDGSSQGNQGSQGDQGSQGGGQTSHVHSGGTATCTDKPICEDCGKAYGNKSGHKWSYECSAAGHKQVCSREGCSEVVFSEYDKVKCDVCKSLKVLDYQLSEEKDSYVVVGIGSVDSANVVIPAMYNQLPVTAICEKAFYKCEFIESVEVPNSIMRVEERAFAKCSSLSNVSLGSGVAYIGDSAFAETAITDIVFPDAVDTLSTYVFHKCYELKSVTARGVKRIKTWAFAECTSLKTVTLSDKIERVDIGIVEGASQDIISVYNGMKYFGTQSNPYAVLIGRDDETRKDVIVHPDTTSIAGEAFFESDIESVTMEDEVVYIGCSAFDHCRALQSVYIGNGVETIGEYAFYECSALVDVHLGSSVKDIGICAFGLCVELSELTLPDSLENIGDGALGDTKISQIDLPSGLKSIGDGAFSNTKLTEIDLPEGLKSIGDGAFSGCANLTSLEIGANVESIGERILYAATSIEEITVSPDNEHYYSAGNCLIEKETKKLIQGCKNSIIPDDGSILIIDRFAFYTVELPEIFYIPESVMVIEQKAFGHNGELSTIVLSNNIAIIYGFAFGSQTEFPDIYYYGSAEEWEKVVLEIFAIWDNPFIYSEEEPVTEGNFWHYVDGVPTPW